MYPAIAWHQKRNIRDISAWVRRDTAGWWRLSKDRLYRGWCRVLNWLYGGWHRVLSRLLVTIWIGLRRILSIGVWGGSVRRWRSIRVTGVGLAPHTSCPLRGCCGLRLRTTGGGDDWWITLLACTWNHWKRDQRWLTDKSKDESSDPQESPSPPASAPLDFFSQKCECELLYSEFLDLPLLSALCCISVCHFVSWHHLFIYFQMQQPLPGMIFSWTVISKTMQKQKQK